MRSRAWNRRTSGRDARNPVIPLVENKHVQSLSPPTLRRRATHKTLLLWHLLEQLNSSSTSWINAGRRQLFGVLQEIEILAFEVELNNIVPVERITVSLKI